MIVLDATEVREGSRLPSVPDAIVSPILESITGSDIMVTSGAFPVTTETLIKRHVKKGAVLIQRKSGWDMVSSITDESINVSLARMYACGAERQYQRVIMSTGFYLPDADDGKVMVGTLKGHRKGKAFIYWRKVKPSVQYAAFATVRREIAMRGGYYLPLVSDDEIPAELKLIERDLRRLTKTPTKELLTLPKFPPDAPKDDDPLQLPVEVRDGRRILAAFDGIGPVKTTALWDAVCRWLREHRLAESGFTESDWIPDTATLLWWASVWDPRLYDLPKVRHWGKGTRANMRKQLGLLEGQDLRVLNVEGEFEVACLRRQEERT